MLDEIDILRSARTIAVVGLSDNPERSSFGVAAYLREAGYRIIPVNPNIVEWEGIPAVRSLRDIDEHVDIVDVFRRSEHLPAIVDDAVAIRAGAVWAQQGVSSDEAAVRAEAAGMPLIQDRCIALTYSKHLVDIKG